MQIYHTVLLFIKKSTPIKTNTRPRIKNQAITFSGVIIGNQPGILCWVKAPSTY